MQFDRFRLNDRIKQESNQVFFATYAPNRGINTRFFIKRHNKPNIKSNINSHFKEIYYHLLLNRQYG
jgi:hypothetical protein